MNLSDKCTCPDTVIPILKLDLPYYRQECGCSCGPASLRMVLEFHGRAVSEEELVDLLETDPQRGTLNEKFANACRKFGFACVIQEAADIAALKAFLKRGFPPIVNYRTLDKGMGHFAVVVGYDSTSLILNDPDCGRNCRISFEEFQKHWMSGDGQHRGWMFVLTRKGEAARDCAENCRT